MFVMQLIKPEIIKKQRKQYSMYEYFKWVFCKIDR